MRVGDPADEDAYSPVACDLLFHLHTQWTAIFFSNWLLVSNRSRCGRLTPKFPCDKRSFPFSLPLDVPVVPPLMPAGLFNGNHAPMAFF